MSTMTSAIEQFNREMLDFTSLIKPLHNLFYQNSLLTCLGNGSERLRLE